MSQRECRAQRTYLWSTRRATNKGGGRELTPSNVDADLSLSATTLSSLAFHDPSYALHISVRYCMVPRVHRILPLQEPDPSESCLTPSLLPASTARPDWTCSQLRFSDAREATSVVLPRESIFWTRPRDVPLRHLAVHLMLTLNLSCLLRLHRPLSSPPANEPSPPLFLPSKMTTLIAQAPVAPTVVLSLPPSSVPESPKPFTAAQKGKGKASAASEPRMVRARRSTASMGVAVGMGGMGGVGERKEIEELVRECRDRMGAFQAFLAGAEDQN